MKYYLTALAMGVVLLTYQGFVHLFWQHDILYFGTVIFFGTLLSMVVYPWYPEYVRRMMNTAPTLGLVGTVLGFQGMVMNMTNGVTPEVLSHASQGFTSTIAGVSSLLILYWFREYAGDNSVEA